MNSYFVEQLTRVSEFYFQSNCSVAAGQRQCRTIASRYWMKYIRSLTLKFREIRTTGDQQRRGRNRCVRNASFQLASNYLVNNLKEIVFHTNLYCIIPLKVKYFLYQVKILLFLNLFFL